MVNGHPHHPAPDGAADARYTAAIRHYARLGSRRTILKWARVIARSIIRRLPLAARPPVQTNDRRTTMRAARQHFRRPASTAASNDSTVRDRQVNLLAGHSAGIKEPHAVCDETSSLPLKPSRGTILAGRNQHRL